MISQIDPLNRIGALDAYEALSSLTEESVSTIENARQTLKEVAGGHPFRENTDARITVLANFLLASTGESNSFWKAIYVIGVLNRAHGLKEMDAFNLISEKKALISLSKISFSTVERIDAAFKGVLGLIKGNTEESSDEDVQAVLKSVKKQKDQPTGAPFLDYVQGILMQAVADNVKPGIKYHGIVYESDRPTIVQELPNGGVDVQHEPVHWILPDGRSVVWTVAELAQAKSDELVDPDAREAYFAMGEPHSCLSAFIRANDSGPIIPIMTSLSSLR